MLRCTHRVLRIGTFSQFLILSAGCYPGAGARDRARLLADDYRRLKLDPAAFEQLRRQAERASSFARSEIRKRRYVHRVSPTEKERRIADHTWNKKRMRAVAPRGGKISSFAEFVKLNYHHVEREVATPRDRIRALANLYREQREQERRDVQLAAGEDPDGGPGGDPDAAVLRTLKGGACDATLDANNGDTAVDTSIVDGVIDGIFDEVDRTVADGVDGVAADGGALVSPVSESPPRDESVTAEPPKPRMGRPPKKAAEREADAVKRVVKRGRGRPRKPSTAGPPGTQPNSDDSSL